MDRPQSRLPAPEHLSIWRTDAPMTLAQLRAAAAATGMPAEQAATIWSEIYCPHCRSTDYHVRIFPGRGARCGGSQMVFVLGDR